MKFVFVVGGSYKGFYLNKLKYIRNIDLLIFNQNIFYPLDSKNNKLIINELIELNTKLKCPIIVYGCNMVGKNYKKCFILCTNNGVHVVDSDRDIYLNINKKLVLVGARRYVYSHAFATISMIDSDIKYTKFGKKYPKNYFICAKKGVMCAKRDGICTKFQKCCQFTLSFYKKMI